MEKQNAIIVTDITKSYNKTTALHGINFSVEKGSLFGLIGPDGAGKSTIIRILASLLLPDSGSASMVGFDVVKKYKDIRKIIGYMPGRFSLYQDMTIEENLNFFASIFNTTVEENYSLIEDIYVQIEPFKNRRAGKLSGGMKQKLALCCALIHRPEVLLLDEPTTGVDAVSRKEFWEMLKKLQKEGITIFVSTPYMDEASLCDSVALIQEGSIMQIDTPADIIKQFPKKLYSLKAKNNFYLLKNLRKLEITHSINSFGEFLHFSPKDDDFDINNLPQFLEKERRENIVFSEIEPNIEDCFMELMTKNNGK